MKERAGKARFDEKIALLGLFLDKISGETQEFLSRQKMLLTLLDMLKEIKTGGIDVLEKQIDRTSYKLHAGQQSKTLSGQTFELLTSLLSILNEYKILLVSGKEFSELKEDFNNRLVCLKKEAENISTRLRNLFIFYEESFSGGQELLLLVTELTVNEYTSAFISQYGCEKYFEHNKELLFHERNKEILDRFSKLEI